MVKNVKLSLAFLIISSVFLSACTQNDTAGQTSGNSASAPSSPTRPAENVAANAANPASNVASANNAYVLPPAPANSTQPANPNAPTATVRARSAKATAGREVTVEIELESKDDISVIVFSLDFDPNVFTYVSSAISPGTPKSAVLTVNAQQTATGKFGAMVDSSTAFANGKKPIMTVVFRVAPEAAAGEYPINFSSKPARQSASTIKTQLVDVKFEPATVRVGAGR